MIQTLFKTFLIILALVVGQISQSHAQIHSCNDVRSAIKRVKARLSQDYSEEKLLKLSQRFEVLRATKRSQGCRLARKIRKEPILDNGMACIQVVTCRIVDGEMQFWPDPCTAALERADFDSLPFC